MSANRPIVAQPGSATITSVRREGGHGGAVPHKQRAAVQRDSRRTMGPAPHRVFVGHTHDPRDAESLMKPEMAWCEKNCRGLWTIDYGSFTRSLGYTVRFGFTDAADAEAFLRYRQHRRDAGLVQLGGEAER